MQSIWLARHGSRKDHEEPHWVTTAERPFDPPLTENGFRQAQKLAQRLKNENIQCIISSPYLRTLQTASTVAKILQLPIKVEAGVGEYLFYTNFSQTPDFPSINEMQKQFPYIDLEYSSKIHPGYPEISQTLFQRCKESLMLLLQEITQDVLIISHGSPIKAMIKALTNKKSDMSYYCALSKIVKRESTFLLEILADVSHL